MGRTKQTARKSINPVPPKKGKDPGPLADMITLCGCYYQALSGGSTITKHLPQVNVTAHTTVFSTLYTTKLSQIFVNDSADEPILDCRYVFPLFDGVSITSFECIIGSRTIRGVVKEKVEAREVYEAAVLRGETAGLLEQGPVTDVFTTSLGNIPPGQKLQVNLMYVGELKHDLAADAIRYTLPTFISPRYGQADSLQSGMPSSMAEGFSITVDMMMPDGCPIEEVRSPSHPVALSLGRTSSRPADESPKLSCASATLSLGAAALDKDFVLEIQCRDSGEPRALLETHPTIKGHRALMTTLVPPSGDFTNLRPELIILADQSGSMSGRRTETLKVALKVLLKSLPDGVTFNVCAFGTKITFLWKKSHSHDQASLDAALQFVDKFDSSHGGTETLSAVQAVMKSRDPTKDFSMVLATDGDIWQQQSLFDYVSGEVTRSKKMIRVFPLGIGNSVSSGLIEGLARVGNGFAQSVAEGERFERKMIRMLKGALTPDSSGYVMEIEYEKDGDEEEYEMVERVTDSLRVMTVDEAMSPETSSDDLLCLEPSNSQTKPSDPASDESNHKHCESAIATPKLLQTPRNIPPLYPSIRTNIYILLSPNAAQATPKTVVLRNSRGDDGFELRIPVEILEEDGATVHALAAKRAMLELEEGCGWLVDSRNHEDRPLTEVFTAVEFDQMVQKEAVRLGVSFQIAGKFTSSVAVESDEGSRDTESLQTDEAQNVKGITIAPAPSPPMRSHATGPRLGLAVAMPENHMRAAEDSYRTRKRKAPGDRPLYRGSSSGRGGQLSTRGGDRRFSTDRAVSIDYAAFDDQIIKIEDPSGQEQDLEDMDMDMAMDNDESNLGSNDRQRDSKSAAAISQSVYELVNLQTFAGPWDLDVKLVQLIGLGSSDSQKPPTGCDPQLWATMLAIAWLTTHAKSQEDVWDMVVSKAETWIKNWQGKTRAKSHADTITEWRGRAQQAVI